MYHPQEKDYYLKKDFYGEYAYAGSIYLSDYCDPEESDNLILYGHHMNNGSMFADLDRYKDPEFGRAHDLIELQTLHGAEYYRVIAAFAVPVYTGNDFLFYGFTKAESRKEYENFIEECREKSLYEMEKTAVYKQRLLTLSTCEYSHKNGRMVVVAVQES
jgi:sortase B